MKSTLHMAWTTQLFVSLGFALVFCPFCPGAQYQEYQEVLAAYGSAVVLPCRWEESRTTGPLRLYWSKTLANVEKTIWRREKSGLEFRSVRIPTRGLMAVPNFVKGDFSLHMPGVTEEDGGRYRCEVQGSRWLGKIVLLRVIKVTFSPAFVVEGSKVRVICDITPQNSQANKRLMQNGQLVRNSQVKDVSQKNAGNWTCSVSLFGLVGVATSCLQVQGISSPQEDLARVYAALGSSVLLPCVFSDRLIQNSTTWERTSGKKLLGKKSSPQPLPSAFKQPPVSSTTLHPNDRSARIESVREADGGFYTCSGEIRGYGVKNVKVQRIVKLVIAQVLSTVVVRGEDPVILTCQVSDSSQVTEYQWLHVTMGINETEVVTSLEKSRSNNFRIQGVTENDIKWICRYYGKPGLLGNATYWPHVSGLLKGKEEKQSGNGALMVLGLGFLFLLIFLTMVQMYRNHRRKKMTLLYPAMETIVHAAATEQEMSRFREKKNVDFRVPG